MTIAYLFDFMGVVGYSRMAVAGDPGNSPTRIVMYNEVVDAIKQLRNAGKKVALVSNNDRELFREHAPDVAAAIDELFDVVVYSSDVGFEKPSPRIYNFALTQLGVDAIDAYYFDDIARNVDAAIALGMPGTVVTKPEDVSRVVDEAIGS
jgi:HAD superfamily hydrolase (TIGR01509 family)